MSPPDFPEFGRGATDVPPPGPLIQEFRSQRIRFSYPQNWELEQRGDGLLVAPPEARLVDEGGTETFTHGFFTGCFHPSSGTDVVGATEELIRILRETNPGLEKQQKRDRPLTLAGRPARRIDLLREDPYVGAVKAILVVIDDYLNFFWWFMFAPAFDFETYASTFRRVVASIGFARLPEA